MKTSTNQLHAPALTANDRAVVAFFALYDSGRKVEADRAYDALLLAARKMVDDEAVSRSERACRV